MNEDRLRSLLRGAPLPGAEEAEARGLRVASEAFAQRRSASPRTSLPRLAVAFAAATLVAALLLSPAGAAVRGWIGDVFTAGVPGAERALTDVPGGGRLLVQSQAGPWAVQPDGSRRLLGRYREATWSPRGLYVAAASGRTLSAIEPDGTPRWSLSAGSPVADPRWSPSGFQIAYRAGPELRVVGGDGAGDVLVDPRVRPLPATWSPQGLGLLAYVDAAGDVRIASTTDPGTVGSAAALAGIDTLEWSPGGSALLEASKRSLRIRTLTVSKLLGRLGIGPARRIFFAADATIQAAAFSPDGSAVAVLLGSPASRAAGPRGEVILVDAGDASRQRLFAVTGRLTGLAFSPDGSRLLTSWPDADQWLFLPPSGRKSIRAIDGIAAEFSPGRGGAPFPRIEGWCCRR